MTADDEYRIGPDHEMDADDLRDHYQEALGRKEGIPAKAVPDPEAMRRLVAGEGPEEERLATLNAVMASTTLRKEFEVLQLAADGAATDAYEVIHGEAEVSSQSGTAGHEHRARSARFAPHVLRRAAAILVVLGGGSVWYLSAPPGASGPRTSSEQLRATASALTLVQPVDGATVGARPTFVWMSVEGAASYSVDVVSADGASSLIGEAADTSWSPAEHEGLSAGEYRWWVTALLPGGIRTQATARSLFVEAR